MFTRFFYEKPHFQFYNVVASYLEEAFPGGEVWKIGFEDIETAVNLLTDGTPGLKYEDISWVQTRLNLDVDNANFYRQRRSEAITGMLVEAAGNLARERRVGR